MSKPKWIPNSSEQAFKRAAGRRRYQAQRRRERNHRQLEIMGILVQIGWQCYGFGRILANEFSVDPATISRDIKYIRKFRASLMNGGPKPGEMFADAIIVRMVAFGIHPRQKHSWTYKYQAGGSVLTVSRSRGYSYPLGVRRPANKRNQGCQ